MLVKRLLDFFLALIGLVPLSPLFFLVAIFIKLDSPGPVFFRQERIGKDFKPFYIYKFRTMQEGAPNKGTSITFGNDPRITKVGRILRKTKIDEFPQLINVLKGEMSFVGPRPELGEFVELFRDEYAEILTVRPGITDLASLKYHNEAEILGKSKNPGEDYVQLIMSEKILLAKECIQRSSLLFDLSLILKTLYKLFRDVVGWRNSR